MRNNKKLLARVKAFDRHANMVLENVKEVSTKAINCGHVGLMSQRADGNASDVDRDA